MSVAFRSAGVLSYGTHTNPSVPAPAGALANDLIVLLAVTYNGSGAAAVPTPPAGFAAFPGAIGGLLVDKAPFSGGSDDMRLWGWVKVSAGSEPGSYAITQPLGGSGYWAGAYSGGDNTLPIPSGWTSASGTGQTSTVPSVTPTVDHSEVVVTSGDNGVTSNTLAIAGSNPTFTTRIASPVVLEVFDGTLSPPLPTTSKSFANNSGAADGWLAAMFVINAAGATTPAVLAPAASATTRATATVTVPPLSTQLTCNAMAATAATAVVTVPSQTITTIPVPPSTEPPITTTSLP